MADAEVLEKPAKSGVETKPEADVPAESPEKNKPPRRRGRRRKRKREKPGAKQVKSLWETQKDMLDHLNRMAMNDLVSLVDEALSYHDPLKGRAFLEDAIFHLVGTYGGVAANLAVDWWDELSLDELYQAKPADLAPLEKLVAQTRWATAPIFEGQDPRTRLASVVQQNIFGAHRDTIMLNCEETGLAYARMAQPGACAFCRVLASRGAVYRSESRALYTGMAGKEKSKNKNDKRDRFKAARNRSGAKQAQGSKFHDHCRCTVAPVFDHVDLNRGSQADQFLEEYQKARDAAMKENPNKTVDMKMLTQQMRKMGHGA